jgi:hypothetical protein
VLWPAGIVFGSDIPEIKNSGLLLPAEVIVTLEPETVILPDLLKLDPTVTLPNETLVGDKPTCPDEAPVPLKETDDRLVPEELSA